MILKLLFLVNKKKLDQKPWEISSICMCLGPCSCLPDLFSEEHERSCVLLKGKNL